MQCNDAVVKGFAVELYPTIEVLGLLGQGSVASNGDAAEVVFVDGDRCMCGSAEILQDVLEPFGFDNRFVQGQAFGLGARHADTVLFGRLEVEHCVVVSDAEAVA